MPITQERFLDILDGAERYVKAFGELDRTARLMEDLLATTRVVLPQLTSDDPLRELLSEYLTAVTLLTELARNTRNSDFESKVLFEQKYFQRNFRRNAKQASYQRNWRLERGLTVNPKPPKTETVADTYDTNPSWTPNIDAARAEVEAAKREENQRKFDEARKIAHDATQRQLATQGISAPRELKPSLVYNAKLDHAAGTSYDPNVVSTSVPSLKELNEKDFIKPGEDVL